MYIAWASFRNVLTVKNNFRLSRSERDNSQKRTLLEDQRTRVKQALENAKSDAESLVSQKLSPAQLN